MLNSSNSSSSSNSSNSSSSSSSSSKMLSWLSPAIRRPEHIRNPPERKYPASAEPQQEPQQSQQQQQQQQQQQEQQEQQEQQQQQLFLDDPLNPAVVSRRTAARVSFFEIKEVEALEKAELKQIKEVIGREIRDKCRQAIAL